jgi:hypothetical protein
MKALTVPKRPKPRVRCPVCSRAVAVDRLGRLVGHGLHKTCPGGYEMARPCVSVVTNSAG